MSETCGKPHAIHRPGRGVIALVWCVAHAGGVNAYQSFIAGWASAVEVLAGAADKSVIDMCRDGLDTAMAKRMHRLAAVYYGPANSPRKQQQARGVAAANGHTMNTLAEIERWVKKLKHTKHAWRVRKDLCTQPAVLRAVRDRAKELVAELNGPPETVNEAQVSVSAIPNSTYMRFTAVAPGHLVRAALDALLATDTRDHPAEHAMKLIAGGGDADGPEISTRVIVRMDDLASFEERPDGEVILSLTNGTRMTGQDYLKANISPKLRIALVAPMQGTLNIYEGRFANEKQREAASIEDPCCVIDGCGVGADYAQFNHNIPYSRGGPTTLGNLSTMCGFHNGRLRDGTEYGSVEKIDGKNYFLPPFGGRPRLNDHPVARGGGLRVTGC